MPLTIGIDIGGTKIAGGLVNSQGELFLLSSVKTPAADGGKAVLNTVIDMVLSLKASADTDVVGVGIGTGGQVDAHTGVVVSATELLPGWAGTAVAASVSAAASLPVRVDNDVNALAWGEAAFGQARGLSTVIFLALGTGVGGALLLNGKLHHGSHWTGGEFGHILMDFSETARVDDGGGRGTLEAFASGSGLVKTWQALTGSTEPVTGEEIAVAASAGIGSSYARAIEITGEYLGYGLVSLANALDPDLIVVGGGLSAIGDQLLDPARRILRERALPGPGVCPVRPASLGPYAGVIGAASLIHEER